MPINRNGQVIVNPSVPMGMEDFAALYTANGQSPEQNASRLWFNAPSEGRSYMADQWNKLGMGKSPEAYFADPAHAAAAIASSSPSVRVNTSAPDALGRIPMSPGNTDQAQWPMYANESASNMAIDLGMDQRASATTPDRLSSSIVGDLKSVPQQDLLDHPELKKMLQYDPQKAHFVYSQLTGGRSFDKDRGEVDTMRRQNAMAQQSKMRDDLREPFETMKSLVKDMIKQDAHFDPQTGKLMLWQTVEPDPNSLDQRPIRKRIEATPEKVHAWKTVYPYVMGMPTPEQQPVDPRMAAVNQTVSDHSVEMQKKIQANITALNPRTPAEHQAIIQKTLEENKPLVAMPDSSEGSRYEDFANSFMGAIRGQQGWDPHMSEEQAARLKPNAWGNFLQKHVIPMVQGRGWNPIPDMPIRPLPSEPPADIQAAQMSDQSWGQSEFNDMTNAEWLQHQAEQQVMRPALDELTRRKLFLMQHSSDETNPLRR